MKIVAVTGILACGKSSVTQFFKEFGAEVASADAIVHGLLDEDPICKAQVVDLLGDGVLTDHKLDRGKIGKRVFSDPDALQKLEEILHPAVRMKIKELHEAASQNGAPLFVVEIPLLFEGEFNHFHKTIVVAADEEECRGRFSSKTGHAPEEFDRRMRRQLSQKEKMARADIVIQNGGSLRELRSEVERVYQELTKDQ